MYIVATWFDEKSVVLNVESGHWRLEGTFDTDLLPSMAFVENPLTHM